MATILDELRTTEGDKPFLSDPFLDWAEGEGIPITEDFGIHLTMYSREPMARIFVTEDRKAEAQDLIEEITGVPPAERKL